MVLSPLFLLLCVILGQSSQKVEVYRYSDRVMVREAATGKETVLFYNNKMSLLEEGDEVIQGSGGISECRFEDDGRVRFFSIATYQFGKLDLEEHIVRVLEFTRILIKAKQDVTLLLPGGTRLSTAHGDCHLEREGYLIHIRNAGFFEVRLSGHLVGQEDQVVPAGHSITVPIYDPSLREAAEPIVVREVAGMIVKTTGGYRIEEKPGIIIISRPDPEDGTACVGGVRVVLATGRQMTFRLK
jgi:hypothetical protein